ncbi:PilW family protein [Pseudoalteromonas phenolica]|uniref:Type IV fimbrial biogenesis protein PilW n=1 Tax=Pseudoalteromonas phenolica TaxID=161398 RepID=A0A0S2K029_9GAMM|nr:PilW family protein [Pseudoalteromonas phenolica]ALO41379.1 Type IV fimbrial biogenesis protein PilW [Pseudoalteromonas phenolica]MBE0354077.1 type IV pilus assembly protein PilW [Pseudoalteromonas phenolica O-BC30]
MKQKGFTILEFLVSMFIGVLILGGVIATYISMKATTRDTMAIGELQETGRLTLSILRRDIEQVGFWGTFYEAGFSATNLTSLGNPNPDCAGGLNNGSFPNTDPTNFRPVYSAISDGQTMLGCVSDSKENTDIIQVKFLEGRQMTPETVTNQNRYYFISEQERAEFVTGSNAQNPLPTVNATLWPYSHHVYYINEQNLQINNRNVLVPVLMRKRLTVNGGLVTEPIMEGIEDMRLVYGIDSDADNRVDTYVSGSDMTAAHWENTNGILTIQVFILVRTLDFDSDLELKNQTYTLGLDTDKRVHTFTDNYRRTVFSTTIRLNNVGSTGWNI